VLSGECELDLPDSWEATPRRFRFTTVPGRAASVPVSIRFAHNETVGTKTIGAKLRLDEGAYLEAPLTFAIEVADFDVRGAAIMEGNDLVLTQTVQNRSSRVIHLRGSAAVPGRERQYRPFTDLRPGELQSAEFRFRNSLDLSGRRALLTVRELNDGPAAHTLELVIP
jgi:hypothetical protein